MGYLRHVGSCFGRCWLEVELSWLVSALSCDMLAARWRFSTKNQKKGRKTQPFQVFLDRLGMRFGAHVGSKRPSWLHLGRLGLDDGKRSMALAIGD